MAKVGRPSFLKPRQWKEVAKFVRNNYPIPRRPSTWTGSLLVAYVQKKYNVTFTKRHAQRILKEIREGIDTTTQKDLGLF